MTHLNATELKTRGVTAIEAALEKDLEAVISVRGKNRYVVMSMEHYNHLRECELDVAIAEVRADVAAGRFKIQTPEEHVAEVLAMIEAEKRG